MPNPYPLELRERVVRACEQGLGSQAEVAAMFGVSVSAVETWLRRFRRYGTLEPLPKGGGNFSKVDLVVLCRLVQENPGAVADELTARYCRVVGRKGKVSRSAIMRALRRAGYVFKKSASGPLKPTGRT